jgi:hypothetical protein
MTTASFAANPSAMSLCDWLGGDWAMLFSNPAHFAPHPSTPRGFHAQIAAAFRERRVKPLALACNEPEPGEEWLLDASGLEGTVCLRGLRRSEQSSNVFDFIGRALETRLAGSGTPFVALLDDLGRCRLTVSYRLFRTDRPRTLDELLCMVDVLRAGASPRAVLESRTRPRARENG